MPDWHPLMETGIAEVDEDHRELVRRINDLGLAMKRGAGRERIAELLTYLSRYAEEHFHLEETLMADAGYPGSEPHRALHQQFRSELARQADAFAAAPAERAVALDIHGWVMTWLSHHTLHEDDSFAVFLREKGQGTPPPSAGR